MPVNVLRDELHVPDKEADYIYKWSNSRERAMMQKLRLGYEVVTKPEEVPEAVRQLNPVLGSTAGVRTRGDVVLMRIRKEVHAQNVQGPINEQIARQRGSLKDMVESARDKTEAELRRMGKSVPAEGTIFLTDDKPFESKQ